MALATRYRNFLTTLDPQCLASDAALHYVTTLVSHDGSTKVVQHLAAQAVQLKKIESLLSSVESHTQLIQEVATTFTFHSSGGAYLPGLDEHSVEYRTAALPVFHTVTFDDSGKIKSICLSWDEASLLKGVGVIDTTSSHWPITDGDKQVMLAHDSSLLSRADKPHPSVAETAPYPKGEGSTDIASSGDTKEVSTPASYAVAHLDQIEEFTDAGCHYRPVRHHLGITALGATAWTARAAGDKLINEHDEDDPTSDQELFIVLRGHAEFHLDGNPVDAPVGTLVFAPPGTRRTALAIEEGTMIMLLEGTPGKGYDARGWELWAPVAPLFEAGEYAKVADELKVLVTASPQYPMLFYNLACCESRCGLRKDAIEHLKRAIEGSEEFRESAKDDSDLDAIRNEPAFKQLIYG